MSESAPVNSETAIPVSTMALGSTVLCKHAIKLESEQLKTIRMDPMLVSALQARLLEVYEFLLPKPHDYEHRKVLVEVFNLIAADSFGKKNGFPIVEPFGSFMMDLFTAGSDLDLSINFNSDYSTEYPRDKKVSELRKFTKFLYKLKGKGLISKLSPILQARVPVVKVVDSGTGIECDVSAENKDGMSRTSILAIVSSIDGRFRILSFLMKAWAKAHDINSSKDRTMNSLSIISLVAFHLQTQDPPILPPFSSLFKDGKDVSSVKNAVIGFKHFGRRNEESVARLFVTLLIKLSAVESLWHGGLCASTYEGTWIKKEWESGVGNMSVEDFLDRSQNFARAVGKAQFGKIYKCIKGSLKNLSRFMEGKIEETKLKERLFGSLPLVTSSENFINEQQVGLKRSNSFHDSAALNVTTAKRARPTEAIEEVHHASRSAAADLASRSFQLNPPTFQLNPPTFQFQPSNQNLLHSQSVYQPRYSSQSSIPHSGYRSRHDPLLPTAPNSGYMSQNHSQLPYAPHSDYELLYNFQHPNAPNSGFRPQYNFQQPSVPNSGFRPQYHHQVRLTPQMGHGIGEHQFSSARNYQLDRSLLFPENSDGSLNNLSSRYSTQGLQRPPPPYISPHWAHGPGYRRLP